jgi:ornithine cyclodeaminase/alanine dehydrogenase-like protein (mu-crystallin family)
MLFLKESEVHQVLDLQHMPTMVELIDEVYRQKAAGKTSAHRRVTVDYPPGEGYYSDLAIRSLIGILPEMNASAVRVYSIYHKDKIKETGPRKLDYTAASEVLLVFRCRPVHEIVAIMSQYRLMYVRTAAPTGVATRYLSREDSHILGVVGAGHLSIWQIAAVCAVRPIDKVRIFSPTPAKREEIARRVREELGVDCEATDNAKAAVEDADIVITVTNANRPVIDGAWLKPGTHINVIARGECSVETIARSKWIACGYRDQILYDSPPFLPIPEVLARGLRAESDFLDLDDYVMDPTFLASRGREDISLFLSQGVGLWDTAVGYWVYEQALANGIGQELSF